jgi:DDB1- and CUL4-associated factor 13
MKVGGGLDNGKRVRRGKIDPWKYIFKEDPSTAVMPKHVGKDAHVTWTDDSSYTGSGIRHSPQEKIDYTSRTVTQVHMLTPSDKEAVDMCDPERPRIFHMYWAGPFTDKPYLILTSYLYTQPLDLHIPPSGSRPTNKTSPCRPQFWVWINPGIQGSVPNPNAVRDMFDTLAANPWSSPFLHKRFHDVVKFKMWNTTERLDAHSELDGWRKHEVLGQLAIDAETAKQLTGKHNLLDKITDNPDGDHGDMDAAARAAMVQLKAADSAQVVMSDLARFLVTHAYGGIYLDVDHVLLRDWEELWNWRGAFAMRWSLHPWYNTAVLKMHPNSAVGSFLLKTAIANDDRQPFHPEAITHYMFDAKMEPLIFRIPDALFDPNFLNMEREQRDRPPFPAYSWDSKWVSSTEFVL